METVTPSTYIQIHDAPFLTLLKEAEQLGFQISITIEDVEENDEQATKPEKQVK